MDNHVLALIAALQYGPVAVSHNVTLMYKNYTEGVLDEDDCLIDNKYPNHSTLLIGYDLNAETPYFILKNSWGKDWGIQGYYRLKIGELSTENQGLCKIAKYKLNTLPLLIEKNILKSSFPGFNFKKFSWNN